VPCFGAQRGAGRFRRLSVREVGDEQPVPGLPFHVVDLSAVLPARQQLAALGQLREAGAQIAPYREDGTAVERPEQFDEP